MSDQVMDQEVMEQEEVETVERQQFLLDDGTTGSRSAYIRQEFKKDKARADIAKELDVPYYVVYSATANMYNAAHPEEGTGRGVMIEDPETGEMIARAEMFRKEFENGMSRGDIAKKYDVPYASVYSVTKDKDGAEGSHGGKIMITLEDGTEVGRADYIRQLYAEGEGKTRREIANELHCDYAVVWAATKEKKDKEVVPVEITDIEDDEVEDEE